MATETKYIEAVGRRKTATARVRITPSESTTFVVNDKDISVYFSNESAVKRIKDVLTNDEAGVGDYSITVIVSGSGTSAQADAIRLGIARALVKEKAERRTPLKKEGFLKRDPRSVERKKFGLRKARKRPAWSKR